MNELRTGAIINYASIIVSLATSFFLTPFVIEHLGLDEYGLFVLSGSVISWLALSDMGLGAAVNKYVTVFRVRHEENEQREFLGQAILLFSGIALITLVIGVVCFFYLDEIFPGLNSDQHATLEVLYLLTLGNMIVAIPLRPLSCLPGCYLKYIIPGMISLTSSVLNAGLTTLLLVSGYKAIGLSVLGVLLGVAGLLSGLVYTIGVLGVRVRFGKPKWNLYREMFRFSFWVLLNQIMDMFYWRAGTPIVARLSGAGAVSLFTLGTSFASYFVTASTAISSVLGTKIMQMVAADVGREGLTDAMIRVGRIQLMILCIIFLGFVVFGFEFLSLWVGASIGNGLTTVWTGAMVLILPLIIPLTQSVGLPLLQAMNMHRGRAIILFYSSLVCVVMGYVLTTFWGPIGMFIGTGVSLVFGQCIMINLYYHRRAGLNIPRFFRETYVPALLPFILLLLSGWGWTRIWFIEGWTGLFVAVGVYGAVCAIVFFVFYLNRYEKAIFLNPLKRMLGFLGA